MAKNFYIALIATLVASIAAYFLEPTGWVMTMCVAAGVSFAMMNFAVRNILAISYRKKLYDLPGGRRIHTTPTPRLGGLAFAPIVCCTTILALALHQFTSPEWHESIPDCLTWICALIFIHMTGSVDDMIGVRYYLKLSAQVVAAVLVVASGLWIDNLGGLFGVGALHPVVGMIITVFFIVGIINALNLIDGMDGLAAGLCTLALVIYGVNSFATGSYFLSLVAFASLGTVIPFFYCNVRGVGVRRRKLFMGDTGSQTLGLIVAVLAVGQMMNGGTVLAKGGIVLVLSPLLVPVFDVAHVMVFRMLRGKHPFHPDMSHIHHRLVRWGFTPHRAVIFILCLAAIYVSTGILLAPHMDATLILALDVVIWCSVNAVVWYSSRVRDTEREITKSKKHINTKKIEHNLNY
jgi:UDP-N-acetylmuramyl pentapeptide phosphotransferase/UDP-N-acetylglucosamine-1-phosphate transferase